jgi:transcription initiation factor TFIIIB Brf1 subunit/transcription initiation factor TFIIB
MSHLTQEALILTYYGELDSRTHLDACAECREELARLAKVLDEIKPLDVPEPDEEFESRVWNRLSWRLRGEKQRAKGRRATWLAAAAMLVIAFLAGVLVTRRDTTPAVQVATATTTTTPAPAQPAASSSTQQQRDRILLVVVSDHFDQSERVLIELTNLKPKGETDITAERDRAEELLASNRLYRTTAADRGEENVATLLDELEPVLMQIAHAPSQVSEEELLSMQKRVETKGLVFKLRVVREGVRSETKLPHQPTI